MATVGYGNYYPRTHMGRLTIVFVCFFGVASISLLVILMNKAMGFNPKE